MFLTKHVGRAVNSSSIFGYLWVTGKMGRVG